MSAAVGTPERSTDPAPRARGWVPWARPVLLLVSGLTVAFTAALHHELGFDRAVVAATLVALGIAHLLEWRLARGHRGDRDDQTGPIPLLLAATAILAGLLHIVLATPIAFGLLLAAWALVTGLIHLLGAMLGFSARGDSVFLGALGVILAILILFFLLDPIAVIGFFGAYAVIAGVYLGISVFDARPKREAPAEAAAPATQA